MHPVKGRLFLKLLGTVLFLLFLGGCTANPPGVFFDRDSQGLFHTNSLERAQREIPFRIVLPTYLPDNLDAQRPSLIEGPIKDPYSDLIGVQINYRESGLNKSVEINQSKGIEGRLAAPEFHPVYLEVRGVTVLREETYMYGGPLGRTPGFSFFWNGNNTTNEVRVFSYGEDEGLKIVESLIDQMK